MYWTWDETKNRINKRKHNLSFTTAVLVFEDPLVASRRDIYRYEERWQTMGMAGNLLLLVIHTAPQIGLGTGEEIGRIISARKATPHERKLYEEGNF